MNISKHNLVLRSLVNNNTRGGCIPFGLALYYLKVNTFESTKHSRCGLSGYRIVPHGTTDSAFITTGVLFNKLRNMHTREVSNAYYKK